MINSCSETVLDHIVIISENKDMTEQSRMCICRKCFFYHCTIEASTQSFMVCKHVGLLDDLGD